jgi:hypothetical protein
MRGDKPFDHDRHCRLLQEAETELRVAGKDALAAAVGNAYSIHRQMESRIAHATRAVSRLQRFAAQIEHESRDLQRYTAQPDAPWIGCELFPEGWVK